MPQLDGFSFRLRTLRLIVSTKTENAIAK